MSPNTALRNIAAAMNGVINEGYEIDCTEGELRLFAWNGNMLHSVGCLVEDGEKRWHVVGRAINE